MKKKYLILLVIPLFFLASCTKQTQAVDGSQAGNFFVNQFVFEDAQEDFYTHFLDGENLAIALQSVSGNITNNFFNDLNSSMSIDEQSKDELINLMLVQMKKHTQFNTLIYATQQEGQKRVAYQIFGLDYIHLVNQVGKQMKEEVLTNQALNNDSQILLDLFMDKLKANIQTLEASETPIITEIYFEIIEGKWQILPNQEQVIRNMYFSFLTGQADEEALNQALMNVIEQINEQMTAAIEEGTIEALPSAYAQ
ncbi:MAG: DUF5105 domain-containing protein [Streptococcaceae bacterium]|jgi:hypothetical protein|nr:DUF5105 domain-containing protein [Streptococcaceae bacterium]